jgi:hypothetical protein
MNFISNSYNFLKGYCQKLDIFSYAIVIYLISKIVLILLLGKQDLLLNLEVIFVSGFILVMINTTKYTNPLFIRFKNSSYYNLFGFTFFVLFSLEYLLIIAAILTNDYSILIAKDPFFITSILDSAACDPQSGPLTKAESKVANGLEYIGLASRWNRALVHGVASSVGPYSAYSYGTTLAPKAVSGLLIKGKPTFGGICLMAGFYEGRSKFAETAVHNASEYSELLSTSNFPNSLFGYLLIFYLLLCFLEYKYPQ